MRSNVSRCGLTTLFIGVCLLLAVSVLTTPSIAGSTGVLKLKVRPCVSTNWLVNAEIDVIIYRPGVGQVDSATGYTNGSGYVEFTFNNLESADQARVTVIPSGKNPDSGHTYYWVPPRDRESGYWDVGIQSESICSDSWYDQGNDIILCLYRET